MTPFLPNKPPIPEKPKQQAKYDVSKDTAVCVTVHIQTTLNLRHGYALSFPETVPNSLFTSLQEDYIDPEDDTDDNYIDPSEKGFNIRSSVNVLYSNTVGAIHSCGSTDLIASLYIMVQQ